LEVIIAFLSHYWYPVSLPLAEKKRMEITTRYIKEIETDVFLRGSSPNIYAIIQDIKDEPL